MCSFKITWLRQGRSVFEIFVPRIISFLIGCTGTWLQFFAPTRFYFLSWFLFLSELSGISFFFTNFSSGASEACINSLVQTQETEVAVSTGKRKSVGDEPKKKKASTEKTEKTEKASKEEKAEKGPKQPLSAYLRFSQDKRASFKEENPTADSKEIMKGLGAMWKEMSEEEKKVFLSFDSWPKGLNHSFSFLAALWGSSQSRDGKILGGAWSNHQKEEGSCPEKGKERKKGEREKGKKIPFFIFIGLFQPVSGYICFSSHSREEVKKENPEMKVTEIMRILGAKWKELSATEKEVGATIELFFSHVLNEGMECEGQGGVWG